jgi:branched-chain amino acid transport system ATP-binding protein
VRDLSAGYGKLPVLRDLSLTFAAGELVAVLGPNGAGKSTLLRTISGFDATLQAGEIRFDGRDLAKLSSQAVVRAGLLQVPEGRQLFGDMSVDDNLRLGGYTRARAEVATGVTALYERFPSLAARKSASAFSLSGGEQQMLALARALLAHPKLLMLDEPSTGLAPQVSREVFELIGDLRTQGTAVLLIEQNAHLALELADRAYVLESGTIALEGRAADLMHDPRVEAVYLGGAPRG